MTRRRDRMEEAGAIHHVFARGNNKSPIFVSEQDRHEYLELLDDQVERSRWNVLAYCLMGNHVHLLIETPDPNLGEGMALLHRRFARAVHGRGGRIGHMFNERYGSSRVWSDMRLRGLLAYLALNPVEAGFCRDPDDWPWSSFGRLARSPENVPVNWRRLAELTDSAPRDLVQLHDRCIEAARLIGTPTPTVTR